jgi:hypothetical protein
MSVLVAASAAAAVRGLSTPASDFAALFRVHSREAPATVATVAAASATASAAAAAFLVILFVVATAAAPTTARVLAALAGDLALFFRVHRREAATASTAATAASAAAAAFLLVVLFIFPAAAAATAVRGLTAPASDLTLFFRVHGREAAAAVRAVGVRGPAVLVSEVAVAFAFLFLAGLVMLGGLPMVVGGGFVIKGGVAVMGSAAALAADFRHVLAVAAHGLAATSSGLGGLFGIELVSVAAFMSRAAALAGDLALFFRVHRGEPTVRTITTRHDSILHW